MLSSFSNVDLLVLSGIGAGGVWLLYAFIQDWRENPNNLPLPPGPKSYPIIGSLLSFPTYKAWLEYDKWFKIYGDMIYFKILGQGFLILGSIERAYDLFERRSSNYSDRPRTVMLSELMGFEYLFGLHRYGAWWRRQRRVFHDYFHPNVVHEYEPIQIETSRALLLSLLESPDKFRYHIRYSFAATIIKVIHGIAIQEEQSYMLDAEEALAGFSEAGNPGTFLVDVFPSMKLIPRWFPGAGWKRRGAFVNEKNSILVNYPWNLTKDRLKAGIAKSCVATAMQEDLSNNDITGNEDEEQVCINVCATAYAGGSETTVSTVVSFFMAMALYPEVQKKAQAELDRVLAGRLPEFNDRSNLPYIHSVVKESQRWQPVTPLAFAHMCSNSDEYDGYHIPKGTIVIGNSWSILHDPKIYEDPLTYNPDRFLKEGKIDPTVRDPATASFGFGRRICPGRFFSENSLFSIVAHVLTVFDIKPGLDENGKEVEIKPDMTPGFLSYPEPFACRIIPRSKRAEELIRSSSLMNY